MDDIRNVKELDAAISLLQERQSQEAILLNEQYLKTYESLKPLNLLKSTFKALVTAPDFKEDLINTSLGFASGYLSKKLAVGSTNNPIKQMLGSFIQMSVTSVVSKNADSIRAKVMEMVSVAFDKKAK